MSIAVIALLQAATQLSGSGGMLYPAPDPWPTYKQACGLMTKESESIGKNREIPNSTAVIIEQTVDCESRSLTRFIFIGDSKIYKRISAQGSAMKFACSSPRNITMFARDHWEFKVELRGPDETRKVATAQGLCGKPGA